MIVFKREMDNINKEQAAIEDENLEIQWFGKKMMIC
jgi:hypothetical protein